MEVRRLGIDKVGVVASIDRSEPVHVEYRVEDGRLTTRPVTMPEIPTWHAAGDGPHSVAAQIAFCAARLSSGADLVGAFDQSQLLGAAIVDAKFEPPLTWLAFLYVSRPHRRVGVASALLREAVGIAMTADAQSLYVSAVPTGSAVGFYLSQGFRLAEPVHPGLHAMEPDDIHLCRPLP